MTVARDTALPHFREFDGLRGYMALWVAIGHAFNLGSFSRLGGWLSLFSSPNLPVYVFIILSGFVITHLLLMKNEPYDVFIGRRFLRLYPMFLFACIAGYLTIPLRDVYVTSVEWRYQSWWLPYIQDRAIISYELQQNFGWHVLTHLTMLHGAIPREWLNFSDTMFLSPAWSISLEWQFYLVAPLVVSLMRRWWGAACVIIVAILGEIAFEKGWLGTYLSYSTLPGALTFFLIGIVTRLGWSRMRTWPINPILIAAIAFACLVIGGPRFVPYSLWVIVCAAALYGHRSSLTGKVFDLFLKNRFSDKLGQVSYSLYLLHVVVLTVVDYVTISFMPQISRPAMLIVNLTAVAATIPLSMITYKLIEQPGIDAGKIWTRYRDARRRERLAV